MVACLVVAGWVEGCGCVGGWVFVVGFGLVWLVVVCGGVWVSVVGGGLWWGLG